MLMASLNLFPINGLYATKGTILVLTASSYFCQYNWMLVKTVEYFLSFPIYINSKNVASIYLGNVYNFGEDLNMELMIVSGTKTFASSPIQTFKVYMIWKGFGTNAN